jgi:thiol-disulfide isomerase/thioredoxin
MLKVTSLLVASSLLVAVPALAQNSHSGDKPAKNAQPAKQPEKAQPKDAKASAKLAVGDPAPALSVEKWVKGDPITGFEKGKIYVVEFWATWCGPCKAQFPHLSEMQKEFKDKGVTFIGTNIWEDKQYSDKTLPKVEKFVKDQGDKMSYTVAFDGPAKAMDKNWMQAAGRDGIPSAFIVDREGKIAWIGHPANGMKETIEKLLGERSSGADKDKSKEKAKEKKKQKDEEAGGAGG